MDSEKWKQLKGILEEALEVSTASRSEYLSKVCQGDENLRREVEVLLEFDDSKDDVLESPAFDAVFRENGNPAVGSQIDKYKIIGTLGAGGMGAVFLAERADGEFTQKVALKVIKRGMDSDAVLRRFINERQILASLEHPNIAHLIDGGTTTDGTPFFVMEYVEGETVTDYATRENLDLEARLKLFRRICAAVAFAHRNLVIHRDLKPSNILVTTDGTPKLLDFGIAKLLKTEGGGETATQNFVFTPEYASPEQMRGEKLTTATDVYSLGVILYELLTENRPYRTDSQNIGEIIRVVCETKPPRPSSVVLRPSLIEDKNLTDANKGQKTKDERRTLNPKSLKGDLDNIILRALRKEPARRYSSVEQFAEDLRRYQTGLPVTASADTRLYRAAKFIRRNRIGVAAAGLIVLSLLAGLFATLYQADKAQRRFNDVRQLANSFLFEFHDAIETLPGATPARELIVQRALEYLDKLAQESGNDATLHRELASAYEKIGKIQGNSYYQNLGDTEGATKSVQMSLQIREKLIARDPNNRDLQFELANSYQAVGDMLYTANELAGSLENYKKSLAIIEKLHAEKPENPIYLYALAENHTRIGDVSGLEGYANLGDTSGALEHYNRAVALGEKLTAADAASEKDRRSYQNSLATWTTNLSMLESTTGDHAKAIVNGQKAIAVYEQITAANPNNAAHKLSLLAAFNFIRFPLSEEMRFAEADKNLRSTVETLEEMSVADPKNTFIRRSLGVSCNALGRTQTEMNDAPAAIKNHRKALQISEELLKADPTSGEHLRDVALTLEFTANAQVKAGDYAAALANYRKALAIYEEQPTGDGDDLAGVYSGIGKCLAAAGNLREAAETFRRAIPSAEKAALKSPLNVRKQSRLGIYYYEGGKVLSQLAQTLDGAERTRISSEVKDWLGKSSKIFGDLQNSGKLSKLNAKFPFEVEKELNKFQ